ncbi:MAG: GNAT family acetyltransferase [Lachnospiraceae bacterium]|nr:GNAT family acetyltransferase [Lachnospiraceae bacterium]
MATETPRQIQRIDLFNIRFYKKTWFHGSFQGMHYRIEKFTDADDSKKLRVTTWPGPYNYDHTDDSAKETALFDFSNEGLDEITEYLNTYHKEHEEEYQDVLLH